MHTTKEKIAEILAEGGHIIVTRAYIGQDSYHQPEYLYGWTTHESGLDANSYWSTANPQQPEKDFYTCWNNLYKTFHTLYDHFPEFVHKEYRTAIARHLRTIPNNKNCYQFKAWCLKLEVEPYQLTTKDYFDYRYFIDYLDTFTPRIEIYSGTWQDFSYKHADFDTLEAFRKHLSCHFFSKKKAGVYAFFSGEKCLYIGKSKNIQSRLEDHWKAAKGINNKQRGQKQRDLFGKYVQETLRVFATPVDDPFHSKIGEELRTTIERLLQLKYQPEFEYNETNNR